MLPPRSVCLLPSHLQPQLHLPGVSGIDESPGSSKIARRRVENGPAEFGQVDTVRDVEKLCAELHVKVLGNPRRPKILAQRYIPVDQSRTDDGVARQVAKV